MKLMTPQQAARLARTIADQRDRELADKEAAKLESQVWQDTYSEVLLRTNGNDVVARNLANMAYRKYCQQATQVLHISTSRKD